LFLEAGALASCISEAGARLHTNALAPTSPRGWFDGRDLILEFRNVERQGYRVVR